MVDTSKQYHELGVLYQCFNQQLKHLQTLIGEIANNAPMGMLLIASDEQLRLEIRLL